MYFQEKEDDCLRSSIRNLLILLTKDERSGEIFIPKNIFNFLQAKEFLSTLNIKTQGYFLNNLNDIKKENFPIIAQIKNGNNNHFIVIRKIDKKYVYYLDSDNGEIKIQLNEFYKVFLHNILIIDAIDKNFKLNKINLLKPIEILLYFSFYIIESITLLFSFYLLNQKDAFPLNLIILLSTFIPIILLNIFNFKVKDNLDKRLLLKYLKKYPSKEDFKYLTIIIDNTIKKINYIVSYLTLLTVSNFIFSFNSLYLVLVEILCILFSYLVLFSTDKNLMKYKSKVIETDIKNKLDNKEFEYKEYVYLKKNIKKLSLKVISPNLYLFIFATITILMSLYANNLFSVNSYLFLIFFSLTYFSSFIQFSKQIISNNQIIAARSELCYDLNEFLVKKNKDLVYTNMRNLSIMEVENAQFKDKT